MSDLLQIKNLSICTAQIARMRLVMRILAQANAEIDSHKKG